MRQKNDLLKKHKLEQKHIQQIIFRDLPPDP